MTQGSSSEVSMLGTSATAKLHNQQVQNNASVGGFHLTNQSSVMQMQQLQHNYSSSQYVSDSSNGVMA